MSEYVTVKFPEGDRQILETIDGKYEAVLLQRS